tara:strand:- start:5380 stop:5601 length:222 start_codon:yes stop_codon:yes gene_type:complete
MTQTIELLICDHSGAPDLGKKHVGLKLKDIPVIADDMEDYEEQYPENAGELTLTGGSVTHIGDDEYDVTILCS